MKTKRMDIYPSPDLQKAVDRWRARQPDIPSRAEAARRLIEKALKDDEEASGAKENK